MVKRWHIVSNNQQSCGEFAKVLNISPIIAAILLNKNLTQEEAEIFLHTEQQKFYDPLLLPNMRAAVARIIAAIYKKEHITIFGDYDVDGITATTLLYKTLKKLGADAAYYLPDRQTEGYGVHKEAVDKFIGKTNLLITVDCGIRSIDELRYAGDYMDVIVTDHHLPGETLPEAVAVIDPQRADSDYPDKNLAGVGVAFKLCQALWQSIKKEPFEQYLDVAALGTVADIVPLIGENRKIVKMGLASITNMGILKLIEVCNLSRDKITAGHIGFVLGPRLNAAGRLKHASMGVELLLSEDADEAYKLALELDKENKIRQELVETAFKEAVKIIEKNKYQNEAAIVVAARNWHQGIIGIAASRIVDAYYRPTVVISLDEDGMGKGSCRSIKEFNICEALEKCSDCLAAFGGHAMAAGLSLKEENINEFRRTFTHYAEMILTNDDMQPIVEIAQVVQPELINKKMIADLSLLEPFGMGNPAPSFLCGGIQPYNVKKIGKTKQHLKFNFTAQNKQYTALGWNIGEYADIIETKKVDLVFQPEINVWNDREYIQLKIKDIKISAAGKKYPSHDMIAAVYLFLKKKINENGGKWFFNEQKMISTYLNEEIYNISEENIIYCLKVLCEIQVILFDKKNMACTLPVGLKEKKDINTSVTFLERYTN
ncbi:single-stranded-DNA-specific exonuclease RecJ [Pectinatus sottacetonis]|uniref:single-stranded-DNA-specific exonuclease RecJ n=1 Tax=Pectinatus sottacetonis TaxID=1002795 RepID=UPI0018C52723|nr:single-stranded-DNA-specific exonuclease RecJ [Pectinatus sottacetonis]